MQIFVLTFIGIWSSLVSAAPQRVLSASLASDEIIWDLLDPGQRSRVVGVSRFAVDETYSHIVKTELKDVALFDGSVEALIKLKPDFVILASFNRPALREYVKRKKINHIVLSRFQTISDISDNVAKVAKALGEVKKLGRLKKGLRGLRVKVAEARPSLLSLAPGFSTMGKESLFNDLVIRAGGLNKAAAYGVKNWGKLSLDRIFTDPPDLIVITEDAPWLQNSVLNKLTSPELKRRLCYVESRALLSTSHHIANAYRQLLSCIKGWRYRRQG
ncbi:ABC transporter substrate-binding protein [Oligoflexaceae bacterium]|nr:ABC transporter substrate-binding protein [Oligoflexaceae bacterium]